MLMDSCALLWVGWFAFFPPLFSLRIEDHLVAMKRIGPKAYGYPTYFYYPVHASRGSRSYGSVSAP
jgi:hypothetical protein